MAVIHISETDAARDLANAMARAHAGEEIILDNGKFTVAVVPSPVPPRRTVSESIALAEAHSRALGYEPVMDANFAADLEEIIRGRKPRNSSAWD